MRLVTFDDNGTPRAGARINSHIINLARACELLNDAPSAHSDSLANVSALLTAGDAALAEAADIVRRAGESDNLSRLIERGHAHDFNSVRLLPPIPRPGKIICVGQNYRAHILEMKRELPKHPVLFAKFPNTLIGHRESIRLPRVSHQLDYEAELMLVIGRRGKDIPLEKAFDYIAGYTNFNDASVRDYQRRTSQFLQGKTFDTTGPVGPAIVTKDEVPDPHALRVQLRLNGETMQDGNTSDFIFNIPTLVNYLSEIMTLEPGDLIATGTPEGVGFARDPQIFLKAGDTVEVEIGNLGVLENSVASSQ